LRAGTFLRPKKIKNKLWPETQRPSQNTAGLYISETFSEDSGKTRINGCPFAITMVADLPNPAFSEKTKRDKYCI
jgi:hypothetical protein